MSNEKKKKFSYFIGIAVAFVLPLSFYLIAKSLKKGHITMPPQYRFEKLQDGDSTFHQVKDISLVNQLGDTVSLNKDLKGKILVVDFIFTTCTSVCPQLTNNMKMLQLAFRKNPKRFNNLEDTVQLISISVNPEIDTFQALRVYADHHGVNHDKWWFLTGDKANIYDYARNELGLSVEEGDGNTNDFIHSQKLIVLDADRNIRGYYNGLDTGAISQCAYDVSLLTMEKKKKK